MSDGTGFDQLCLMKNKKLYMNGPAVFEFTKKIVPLAVKRLLKDSKLNLGEIDSFYFNIILPLRASRRPGPRVHRSLLKGF